MDDRIVSVDDDLMSQEEFENVVEEVLNVLPEEFQIHLVNLLIVVEDAPSEEQRKLLHFRRYVRLYGLYQGIPLIYPGRDKMVRPPDTITIFRNSILESYSDDEGIRRQIKSTVLHEIGHYFGLEEGQLRKLEKRYNSI